MKESLRLDTETHLLFSPILPNDLHCDSYSYPFPIHLRSITQEIVSLDGKFQNRHHHVDLQTLLYAYMSSYNQTCNASAMRLFACIVNLALITDNTPSREGELKYS